MGSVASPATAADAEAEARERYERALKLYEERDFEAALVELKLAAELRPSFKLMFNIAQVRLAMNDHAAALEAYREYLSAGGDKVPAARRESVQREMKRLEQRVAQVTIETDVPGAEVVVDDVTVGTTPLKGPVLVNAGFRQVAVRHPEYVPQSRRLSVGGNTQHTVRFAFLGQAPASASSTPPSVPASSLPGNAKSPPPRATGGASPAPAPTTSTEPQSGARIPWVAWGITGALAAGAAVTGVLALSENSSLDDELGAPAPSPRESGDKASRIDSSASKVKTLAIVTDTLLVATVVAGGVSLWLTLDSGATPERSADAARWRVGLSGNQVALSASF